MNSPARESDAHAAQHVTILCVDDEPVILASLRGLFRATGCQVLTAENGRAGLGIMESQAVDLVVCDLHMPEMNGAAFLEQVHARWPDTIRLLLTEYADIQSITDAINRDHVHRYITKPCNDADLLLVVQQAIERKLLEREKQRLEDLTRRQNEDLKALNARLESMVEERTVALTETRDELMAINKKLKANFVTSIKIFSSLIEMREAHPAGHSGRVAELARRIAQKMKLDEQQVQEVFIAALLKDIAKIGYSDELLSRPMDLMYPDEIGRYRQHPVRAEQLLMPLEDLRGAARILRSQSERFDGRGYPDSLAEHAIPLGARILALASDYDNLQIGAVVERCFSPAEARELVVRSSGRRYDPQVVQAFRAVLADIAQETAGEHVVSAAALCPGMVLARDLLTREGIMMLPADRVLDDHLIDKILDFEVTSGVELSVCVRREARKPEPGVAGSRASRL